MPFFLDRSADEDASWPMPIEMNLPKQNVPLGDESEEKKRIDALNVLPVNAVYV